MAYFQRLARTTLLEMPERVGTPGSANSRRVSNAGPVLSGLAHQPPVPRNNQSVTVSVSVKDPDGLSSVTLRYRLNGQNVFSAVAMSAGMDGNWAARIPAQAAGMVVQFYVEAVDSFGASSFAPAAGPEARALYQVADSQGTNLAAHEIRLIQLDADRDFMFAATNLMSQGKLGETLIYDRSEVFYDVETRLHGSASGRARDGDDFISYDISFPSDRLFRSVHGSIGIDRSGRSPVTRGQDEIYILHMFQKAGLPVHQTDLCYFIAPRTIHTGTAILQLGAYDSLFAEEQFARDGSVFNLDVTYEPSTTVDGTVEGVKLPVPLQPQIGPDFEDLGDDKEQYRGSFSIRLGERADDYSGLMRLAQTMGRPQGQFDDQIAAALDVNEAVAMDRARDSMRHRGYLFQRHAAL